MKLTKKMRRIKSMILSLAMLLLPMKAVLPKAVSLPQKAPQAAVVLLLEKEPLPEKVPLSRGVLQPYNWMMVVPADSTTMTHCMSENS